MHKRAIAGPGVLSDEEQALYLEILIWWDMQLRPARRFYTDNRTIASLTTLPCLAIHLDDTRAQHGLYPLPAPVVIATDQREFEIQCMKIRARLLWQLDLLRAMETDALARAAVEPLRKVA